MGNIYLVLMIGLMGILCSQCTKSGKEEKYEGSFQEEKIRTEKDIQFGPSPGD